MPQPPTPSPKSLIRDVTCIACGCTCDDVEVEVVGNAIVGANSACAAGEKWFLREWPDGRPACLVDGRPARWEEGCRRAAEILSAAKRPLVYGLSQSTCETQQLAVAIADWIGARVAIAPDNRTFASAVEREGQMTATLGEVAARGDFILFWKCDPATTHPRHFERYSLEPRGLFVPGGRQDRTCVVVDSEPTATSAVADQFLQMTTDNSAMGLQTLIALASATEIHAAGVESQTGIPLVEWQALLERMKLAKYGVVFFDSELASDIGAIESLLVLVRELNRTTRFVCLSLGERGNPCGAEQVLTWRSGHPAGVDFSKGFPEVESELEDAKPDAALVVGIQEDHPPLLAGIPTVAIGHLLPDGLRPAVAFQVATYGIHTSGTVFRCDGVPLPLRAVLKSDLPTAEEVLTRIEAILRSS